MAQHVAGLSGITWVRSMRRRLVRIFLVVVVGLLAALGSVQVLLWTDLPGRWVCSAAAKTTGLGVKIGSLKTIWRGRTRLADVTVALPMEQGAVLSIDHAELVHGGLLGMLARRKLGLRSVTVDGLKVQIKQDEQGRWNVQDVVDMLGPLLGRGGKKRSGGDLPAVQVVDGQITLTDRCGQSHRWTL